MYQKRFNAINIHVILIKLEFWPLYIFTFLAYSYLPHPKTRQDSSKWIYETICYSCSHKEDQPPPDNRHDLFQIRIKWKDTLYCVSLDIGQITYLIVAHYFSRKSRRGLKETCIIFTYIFEHLRTKTFLLEKDLTALNVLRYL